MVAPLWQSPIRGLCTPASASPLLSSWAGAPAVNVWGFVCAKGSCPHERPLLGLCILAFLSGLGYDSLGGEQSSSVPQTSSAHGASPPPRSFIGLSALCSVLFRILTPRSLVGLPHVPFQGACKCWSLQSSFSCQERSDLGGSQE